MFWFIDLAQAGTFMPVAASNVAKHVDSLYAFLLWASLISCVLVIGGFIYFSYKYKRKTETDKTAYITHNNILEFTWSFIPFVIFMVVFGWGVYVYLEMRTMPVNALEVSVQAQKWNWTFLYKSGKVSASEFYVPVGEPIKLVMGSKDVIHSFYLPAFRNKQDVVPGRYTAIWFQPEKQGVFQVFCAEFCGDQHSGMMAKMHVVSRAEFDQWLQNDPYKNMPMAEVGKKVYQAQCIACHNLTAEHKVGPGWFGVFGNERVFVDGSKATADENYIRESIMNPNNKVVAGFQPLMPTFAGQLSEQEISGVIEFIKSLK